MKQSIALGLDPGLRNTGWAVIKRNRRGQIRILACGCIQTDKKNTESERILEIYTDVTCLIKEYTPDLLAVELVFFGKNISSAMSTQSVITLCLLASEQAGILCCQITPTHVKAAVTGTGRADKQMVRRYIEKITNKQISNPHTTDATAVAIAGLLKQKRQK